MKRIFILLFSTAIAVVGGMIFDYMVNSRETDVDVYEISTTDIQESFHIKGDIEKIGKIHYIFGTVKEPLDITEGAQASVYLNGTYYDGYLQSLNRHDGSLYTAAISIVSEEDITGKAEAYVYGKLKENIIIVPYSCIFTDEDGKESVMVVSKNYCVKRNVELGKINNEDGTQITEGLFAEEKVVLNPQGLESGEKISYDNH